MSIFKRRNSILRSPGEIVFDGFNVLLMLVVALIMIYPFWYVLIYSLNTSSDAASGGLWLWPRKFTLGNIAYVLNRPNFQLAFVVTVARTVLGPLLHLVVTGLAAYTLSKRYLPGRKAITYYLIVPFFIGGPLVATYVLYARLHLMNNFLVYILPGAFSFYMMAIARALFEEMPLSLEESAKMDGAGYLRIFFQLILPLSTPIVATILIFSAVGNWLDFFTSFIFVQTAKLATLQYLLFQIVNLNQASQGMMGPLKFQTESIGEVKISSETIKATTLMVITVPIIFIYPFFQGYIIKGLLIGSIKE
jgi:putative aldouronate transport system permease protein